MNDSPVVVSESDDRSPGRLTRQRKRKRSPSSSHPTGEFGFMRDNGAGKRDSPRFVGSGSGIYFIRNVYMKLSRRSVLRSSATTGGRVDDFVPGEDDQLHHQDVAVHGRNEQVIWRADEITDDVVNAAAVSFEKLVEWSKSYFAIWHPALPFLNAAEVLEWFEQVEQSGIESLTDNRRLILRSVMSISLADSRQGRKIAAPVPAALVFKSIDDALAGVQIALRRPATMSTLQAAVCVLLFLLSMLRLNAASRLGGLISRTAFHLGLHRCPARYQTFDQKEGEMRRRVFWSIYCAERFLCQSLGLPLDIRDDDIDVCYPGEEVHGNLASSNTEQPENPKQLQMLTFLAKHARIRGLVLELRNKSIRFRGDTADQADHVHAELAKWVNEVQDTLDEDLDGHTNMASLLSPSHKLFLTILKNESIISLNRPLMASDPLSPSYAAALQHCISAARTIIVSMNRQLSNNRPSHGSGDTALFDPLIWPSYTWAVWISTFVLMFSAFEQKLPVRSALRLAEQARQVLQHISTRSTFWPEYCLSAIDDMVSALGETPESDVRHNTSAARGLVSSTSGGTGQRLNESNDAEYGNAGVSSQYNASDYQDAGATPLAASSEQYHATTSGATEFDDMNGAFWQSQFMQDPFNAIGYPFLAATSLDPLMDPMASLR